MKPSRLAAVSIILGGLLCTLDTDRAHADLLVPGTKWIRHEIVIDNLADFPNDQLFIYLVNENQAMPIEAGKPIPRGNGNPMNTVLMVSVPRDVLKSLAGKLEPGWFVGRDRTGLRDVNGKVEPRALPAGVLISKEEVDWIRSISAADRTQRIVTHIKVTKAKDDLTWKTVREERFDGVENPVSAGSLALPVFPSGESSQGSRRTAMIWAVVPALALLVIGARLARRRSVAPTPAETAPSDQ